tara:strand:+ start:11636 stop:12709 length:1074 start_codon:yes stop_codon:yes gene_type:complete
MSNSDGTSETPGDSAPPSVKPKRGRRSKKEIAEMKEKEQQQAAENIVVVDKPPPKKRGRKPKGGKIIEENVSKENEIVSKPNIMLHLKCSTKDLDSTGHHESDFTEATINSYDKDNLPYHAIDNNIELTTHTNTIFQNVSSVLEDPNNNMNKLNGESTDTKTVSEDSVNTKELHRKLKNLEQLLHVNSIPDSKSACFWCTYDFDNPPIYIPKFYIRNSYSVYGCFCSPECACAHLMNEKIDSSSKFERYSLLNNMYSKVYGYSKNIKPAPDPHYLLERFCGNLSINEYRSLLKSDRLFLVVDKPMTRVLPELHEDNDEFIINNKIIPSSANYNVKKKSRLNTNPNTGENFGIFSMVG